MVECKYPRLPYRRADEPLPDTGYGRQLHLQRLHCIPEGFRHTDFCHTRLEIHQYRQLYTLHPCQYGHTGRIWILRHPARSGHRILRLPRIRCREHSRPRDEEPKRNMPIGILVSLLVCTVLYMVFAHVMTGVAHYTAFSGQQGIAPVAIAIEHMGQADAAGIIQPDYPWLNRAIVLSILFGYCSVIMVTLLGQSRVFLSMSHDGLLPPFFSHINEKFRTPARSNLLFMVLVGLLAAFVPARLAGEMTSIGTLMAFTLVCAAVLVVRRTMPDVPRSFKTPLVPLIPILGILTCLCMMLFLPADTWIRLVLWMLIGLDIYVGYGMKHSKLEHGGDTRHGQVTLNMIGLILAVLCVITGLWHQQTVGWGESKVLLIISFVFAFTHCAYYMWRIWRR